MRIRDWSSDVCSSDLANNGNVNIPGITAIAGQPDPAFPNALPVLGFIQSSFTNQDQQTVSGIDFGARASLPIGNSLTWRTDLDASYMLKYELQTDDGDVLRYDEIGRAPSRERECPSVWI